MHLHLPKPLHGWRQFVGEVGIIVIGVLIALGAQQLAEDWSDRQRVERAVAALREEFAADDLSYISYEVAAPCVYAQIDSIERKLASGSTAPLPLYRDQVYTDGFVIRFPTNSFSDSAWHTIESADLMRLLDPKLAAVGSTYYGRFDNLRHFNLDAISQISALNALSVMMPSGEEGRLNSIERLEQLREDMFRFELAARQMRSALAGVGMLPDRSSEGMGPPGTAIFCRKHGFPVGKVARAEAG
jgi:hypothetical protein